MVNELKKIPQISCVAVIPNEELIQKALEEFGEQVFNVLRKIKHENYLQEFYNKFGVGEKTEQKVNFWMNSYKGQFAIFCSHLSDEKKLAVLEKNYLLEIFPEDFT